MLNAVHEYKKERSSVNNVSLESHVYIEEPSALSILYILCS